MREANQANERVKYLHLSATVQKKYQMQPKQT